MLVIVNQNLNRPVRGREVSTMLQYFNPKIHFRIGEMKIEYKVLVGKCERKRPLGRSKRRWEGNIKINLLKNEAESVDWIHFAQNRVQ
jgi:hypothetical protein